MPLATLSRLLEKIGIRVDSIPLSYYRNLSFYTMRTDARDRFGTPLEQRFTRDELYTAEEAFFTGTAAEITPIREADNRRIGIGKPGPVTLDLQKRFFAVVRGENPRYKEWLTPV